ncbi:hypothetical protein DMENIID0001_052770 [Sergentomyia squamirostris]
MDSPRRSQRANKGVPPRRYGDFVGGDEIDEVASNHSEETVLADNGNGENVNANGERKSSSPAKLPLEPEVRVISRHSSFSSLSSKRSRRSQAETVKAKLQISIEETKLKLELLSLEKQLANVQEELDQSLDSDDFVSESDGTELRLPVPNGKVRGGSDEVRKENIQFSKIQAQSTPIKQCSDTNYHTAFEPTVFPEVESGVAPEGAPKVPAIQKKRNMPIVPQKIVPEEEGNNFLCTTLRPRSSSIITTSVLRGPMWRVGKSVLLGNSSGIVAKDRDICFKDCNFESLCRILSKYEILLN